MLTLSQVTGRLLEECQKHQETNKSSQKTQIMDTLAIVKNRPSGFYDDNQDEAAREEMASIKKQCL